MKKPTSLKFMGASGALLLALAMPTLSVAQTAGAPSAGGSSGALCGGDTGCDCDVLADMMNDNRRQQEFAAGTIGKIWGEFNRQSPVDDVFSGCIQLQWPTGMFSLPTLSGILDRIKEEVVRRACSLANERVSSVTTIFNQNAYLDFGIPGVSAGVGVSTWGANSPTPIQFNGQNVGVTLPGGISVPGGGNAPPPSLGPGRSAPGQLTPSDFNNFFRRPTPSPSQPAPQPAPGNGP